jgi:hypothetical protein
MMQKQTEFTFTMGSDRLLPVQWLRLQKTIADMVSRDFGGCRFVIGYGAWREGADQPQDGPYHGQLHHDDTLTLIVAVPVEIAEPAFALIQSSIAATIKLHHLTDRLDWIDTTEREVTARHWDVAEQCHQDWEKAEASKFFTTDTKTVA